MDCEQQMANRYQDEDAASSSRRQYHAGGRRAACDRPETLQSPLLSPGSACGIVLHHLDYMARRAEAQESSLGFISPCDSFSSFRLRTTVGHTVQFHAPRPRPLNRNFRTCKRNRTLSRPNCDLDIRCTYTSAHCGSVRYGQGPGAPKQSLYYSAIYSVIK